MQRGVKALVLYPMNALVADQTVRIRNLFGTHKMAQKLQQKGAGRYCQFGMYTGRTPSHGWYSEPGSGEGKWKIKDNGPRGKVKNIVEAYGHIEKEHPETGDEQTFTFLNTVVLETAAPMKRSLLAGDGGGRKLPI